MVVASSLLALTVVGAFAALLVAVADLRDAAELARHTREELVAADELEKLIIDLETGVRGFVITGEERFLEPWIAARTAFPEQARRLERLAAEEQEPGRVRRVRRIVAAGLSYIRDYATPLIEAAQRNDPSVRSVARTEEGKRRIDAIRAQFDALTATERALLNARQASADAAAQRAIAGAALGLAASIVLIVLFTVYLTRAIVHPVRRAAAMAGRLAGGDLSTRMPETGAGEIGDLERAFNTMGESLETSRDELQRIAEEQAALRRVATLVARGTAPETVFAAVAEEAGALRGAEFTHVTRFEPDGTATLVGSRGWVPHGMRVGARWSPERRSLLASLREIGDSVRFDEGGVGVDGAPEPFPNAGIRSAVASPIVVEGRLWGAIVVGSRSGPLPSDTEQGMADFTEIVATAIGNAESRAQLAASRARIVTAADETRRRIERDLHDGTQQRLVALTLAVRAAQASVPGELDGLRTELSEVADGLNDVVLELQEISRGIHPAILSQGGLAPALRTLARRSPIPVEIRVDAPADLPDRVEVAAYYVVSEALTNATKHAAASVAHVDVQTCDGMLELAIRDDGAGGADPARGSGLVGLADRVEALGGTLQVVSPVGEGTSIVATLPVDAARPTSGAPSG